MSKLKHIHSALHQASLDTTRVLGAHLRSETRASGWPHEITRRMRVSYDGDSFHVHSHPGHSAQVADLEYGTPSTQPTAAIRRFSNRTHEAESFLTGRMHQLLGKSL